MTKKSPVQTLFVPIKSFLLLMSNLSEKNILKFEASTRKQNSPAPRPFLHPIKVLKAQNHKNACCSKWYFKKFVSNQLSFFNLNKCEISRN